MVTHNGAAKGGTRNQITFMLPPELRIELERELEEANAAKGWGRTTLAEHCRAILSAHVENRRAAKLAAKGERPSSRAMTASATKARARR